MSIWSLAQIPSDCARVTLHPRSGQGDCHAEEFYEKAIQAYPDSLPRKIPG